MEEREATVGGKEKEKYSNWKHGLEENLGYGMSLDRRIKKAELELPT